MSRIYESVDRAYAQACSDVTLCSDARGFFRAIIDEAVAIAENEQWLQRFEKVSDADKVTAVMDNKEVSMISAAAPAVAVRMSRIYESVDRAYAQAGSDVTLCSDARGFFRAIIDEAVAIADNEQWLLRFEKVSDADKVTAVMDNKELMEWLREVLGRATPLHRGKDARVSCEKRDEAARALRDGRVREAIALASQAVLRAPPTGSDEAIDGGVTLALSLWTRAEALLQAGCASAALADLKLALKERLPARVRAQYYWRMGHCYRDLCEPSRAKVSYELAGRLLSGDDDARAQLNRDIEGLDYGATPKTVTKQPEISVTGQMKQNMPALSKLVKITEEENKGRFAVAQAPIQTGDVLLVDSPYAACLLADCYGTHCLHCFSRLDNYEEEAPVWCPKCSRVAFCSLPCRDAAVNTYHSYECQFLDLFIGSGMSILSHIALRMVTQAGFATTMSIHSKHVSNSERTVDGSALNDIEGNAKKSRIKSRKERLNRAKKGLKTLNEKNAKDDKDDNNDSANDKMSLEEKMELLSAQIYSLCTHSELRTGGDYLKRIVMGMFLTECLKKAGFFSKCEGDDLQKAEKATCEVLVRNLQLLQFNAHEIYETVRGAHQFSGSKPLYIAVGIYPTGALFNHECYPAVARYFEGRKIVLRATRPLAVGEVVSENYGPHFMVRTLKERQRALASRYWFRCACVACVEDWPMLKQMTCDEPPFLRCPNTSCPAKFKATSASMPSRCPRCSNNIDKDLVKHYLEIVDRSVRKYQEGAKLMDEEQADAATSAMCAGIDLFHEAARAPHRETHLAQEALRSCFAARGNVHTVRAELDSDNQPKPS